MQVWMARPPGSVGDETPEGLAVLDVTGEGALREFEIASIEGFESPELHALGRLGLHGGGILDDDRMHVFGGRSSARL